MFIESSENPAKQLILDFDCTDDPVHGHQIERIFHGYHDCDCFLPLYVICGRHILWAYLRPSNIDPVKGALAILKLLTDRSVKNDARYGIIFRADIQYGAHSWSYERRVIVKAEQNRRGSTASLPIPFWRLSADWAFTAPMCHVPIVCASV